MSEIIEKFKSLFSHRIVKSTAALAGGTALAQISHIIAAPVLTRLYQPEAIGIIGIIVSVITILATVSTLAFAFAIALPKKDCQGIALLSLSNRINLVFAGVVAVLIIYFKPYISLKTGYAFSNLELSILVLIVLIAGYEIPFFQWLVRKKRFGLIGKLALIQAVFQNLFKIIGGIVQPDAMALLIAVGASHVIYSLALFKTSCKEVKEIKNKIKENFSELRKTTAVEYKNFPMYQAPQMLLNSISHGLPMMMFGGLFSAATAGFYSISNKVLQLPGALIARSLGCVILPELAESSHDPVLLRKKIVKGTFYMALLGTLPFGLVFIFGQQLFAAVFGPNWSQAGTFASWLSLQVFFQFTNVIAVQSLVVTKSQRFLLIWEITTTLGKLLVLYLCTIYYNDATIAVAAYSIFGSLAYIILVIEAIRRAKITPEAR